MSLGKQLEKTLKEMKDANLRKSQMKDTAQLEEIRKQREKLTRMVDDIIQDITTKIEAGIIPHYTVEDYSDQQWIFAVNKQGSTTAHADIWDRLTEWASENELTIKISDEHDGMGMKSWIGISAQPA